MKKFSLKLFKILILVIILISILNLHTFAKSNSGNGKYRITYYVDNKVFSYTDYISVVTIRKMSNEKNRNFLGWSKTSGGKVAYQGGEKITLDKSLKLYARWKSTVTNKASNEDIALPKERKYKVVYDTNGGNGSLPEQTVTYGSKSYLFLIGNNITKEGFKFKGWIAWRSSDQKIYGTYNGKKGWFSAKQIGNNAYIYKDGQQIGKQSTKNGDTIRMIAQWKRVSNSNNGGNSGSSGGTQSQSSNIKAGTKLKLKKGYTWYTFNSNFTKKTGTIKGGKEFTVTKIVKRYNNGNIRLEIKYDGYTKYIKIGLTNISKFDIL